MKEIKKVRVEEVRFEKLSMTTVLSVFKTWTLEKRSGTCQRMGTRCCEKDGVKVLCRMLRICSWVPVNTSKFNGTWNRGKNITKKQEKKSPVFIILQSTWGTVYHIHTYYVYIKNHNFTTFSIDVLT